MKKVIAIVQARMGSSRLPGKVMMKLKGKTVLLHDIERLRQASLIDEIVIATTDQELDCIIAEEAIKNGTKVFRGSEQDVLSRYYHAGLESKADIVVRITSDCPLIDSNVVDEIVGFFLDNNYELVTNGGSDLNERTYPRGLDTEVFSMEILREAFEKADKDYQKEHVTPYIYENSDNVYYYKNNVDYSKHRWTLDTEEDLELISEIYDELYKGKHDFYLDEILELFEKRPELYDINSHVEQKKV